MKTTIRGRSARVLAASALALGTALAVGVPVAGAAATAAQKVPLTDTNRGCDGAVDGTPSSTSFGFVVINKPASGKLIAVVALKGAHPNTTYNIRLIQLGGAGDCGNFAAGPFDGKLTTDSLGDGNANVQEPVLTGAGSAFVAINNSNSPEQAGTNFYTTPVVTF